MFEKATDMNDYFFKNVFREFDGDALYHEDINNLVDLFLEPEDRSVWKDKSSPMRIKWSEFISKEHPECKNWNAKEVKKLWYVKTDNYEGCFIDTCDLSGDDSGGCPRLGSGNGRGSRDMGLQGA